MAIHINDPSCRHIPSGQCHNYSRSHVLKLDRKGRTLGHKGGKAGPGSGSGSPSRRLEIEGQTVIKYLQSCASEGVVGYIGKPELDAHFGLRHNKERTVPDVESEQEECCHCRAGNKPEIPVVAEHTADIQLSSRPATCPVK